MVAILDPELHGPGELEGLHGGLDDAPFPHPLDPGEHCVVGVGLLADLELSSYDTACLNTLSPSAWNPSPFTIHDQSRP